MTLDYATSVDARCGSRTRWHFRWLGVITVLFAANVFAADPTVMENTGATQSTKNTGSSQSTENTAASPSDEELEKLVAPFALYPDDLVALILPASTFPLQIVQADRFLEKRKADPKLPVDEEWDDSVKSLLNYPTVVKNMSNDLDTTAALGEAVVADTGAVLEAVQVFRRKAYAVGNLKSDEKQTVEVEAEVIKIVPADPQVIYVPQYNPTTIVVYGGYSYWGYWPTPYPVYYYPYPPGAAFGVGLIWGMAIGGAWHGGHYVSHYGGNANINIDRNTNINIDRDRPGNRPSQQPNGGRSEWKSDKQPGQVGSSVGKRPSTGTGNSRPGGPDLGSGGTTRPSTQPSTGNLNNNAGSRDRQESSRSSGDAFGGYSSGRQTQMDSSRGASSRNSMSRPSGGGGMRGGGGGMRGGGGGGRR